MKLLLPVLITALLTACGGGGSPSATDESSSAADTSAHPDNVASVTETEALSEPLPESISLTFPYHARYSRIIQRDSGDYRRHVLIEFLGGDVHSSAAQIGEDIVAAGFTTEEPKDRDDGGLGIRYNKDGYGRLFVIVRPAESQDLRHVEGKGSIRLDFPAEMPTGTSNLQ